MDFRKECRQDLEGRCPSFLPDELRVCGVATMAEVYVARNVYMINVAATIAISSSSCEAVGCLQHDPEFAPLLGTVYKVEWHPSELALIATSLPHERQYTMAKDMITRDYVPIAASILRQLGHETHSKLWEFVALSYVSSDVELYADIFVPPLDMAAIADQSETVNLRDVTTAVELDQAMHKLEDIRKNTEELARRERLRFRMGVKLIQLVQQQFPDVDIGWAHEARRQAPDTTKDT